MKPAKCVGTPFFPAAWWNERQMEQWKARSVLAHAIRINTQVRSNPDSRLAGSLAWSGRQKVRIVAISEEPFGGGEKFARALAARLGWQFVDSVMLIERAVARGCDRSRLMAALKGSRSHWSQQQVQILLLQAVLAEMIKGGNVVCYGIAADLLNLRAREVRRIAIVTAYHDRRAAVEERMKLYGAEARIFLNECDRACRQWRMQLLSSRAGLPLGYDLALNLEEMSLDEAFAATFEMICERNSFSIDDSTAVRNFVLTTSLRAKLATCPATAHLNLDVEILNDSVILRGRVKDSGELELVKRVILPVSLAAGIDLSQIRLAELDGNRLPPAKVLREGRFWRRNFSWVPAPRIAWAAAGLAALFIAAIAGFWFPWRWSHPVNGHPLNIAGVITDSDCALSHNGARSTAECVRTCVRERGARFVLSDGVRMFTLSDQRKGAVLAGQKVVAVGYLDRSTGDLQLRSVRTAAR